MAPPESTDPQTPPQPQPPYFDASSGVWVLSRYRDVVAALREPLLWPPALRGDDLNSQRDESGRLLLRRPAQKALARVDDLEERITAMAHRLIDALPVYSPTDLLADFAIPWCLQVALLVLKAPRKDGPRLAALGAQVFAATGAPEDSPLKPLAAAATAELNREFQKRRVPMGEPTFVAISQTSPRLLANIWVALYRNVYQAQRLRDLPGLWPAGVNEMIRYAGIVRRIRREARDHVEVAGVTIFKGQRVVLLLASANRDPELYEDPGRFDVMRHALDDVALGMGRNSCIGDLLIRGMVEASTRPLVERFPEARLCGKPEFLAGSGYCFPTSVPVLLDGSITSVQ